MNPTQAVLNEPIVEMEAPAVDGMHKPINPSVMRWNFIFQYGYVITNIINSVILLPLYLLHIPAELLGLWLASGNILTWITLTDPGVGDVLQQRIAELRGQGDRRKVGQTIGSGLLASLILLIISIAAGLVFFLFLGKLLNRDLAGMDELNHAMLISVLATALSLFSFSMTGINQGLHNSSQVAVSALLGNVSFLVMNVILLQLGWGLLSIALANLTRNIFINVYNMISMRATLRRTGLEIKYSLRDFKSFIRIFSVTSAARIVGGLANSIDLMILARYSPAATITLLEINKRPIKLTQSLIGRHSAALMPSISHAKGSGDRAGIRRLITNQFALYSYAVIFLSVIFWITYPQLIGMWVGTERYAGNTVLILLVLSFAFGLIGYFMANMGYALGDIKRNSIVSIIRGVVNIGLLFLVAKRFGLTGILVVSLFSALTDFFYFSFRLFQIGFLDAFIIRKTLSKWSLIVPLSIGLSVALQYFSGQLIDQNHPFLQMTFSAGLFTMLFSAIVLMIDGDSRVILSKLTTRAMSMTRSQTNPK